MSVPWTPPLVILENFLSENEHEQLIQFAREHRQSLVSSGVLGNSLENGVDHDVRKSLVGHITPEVTHAFSERLDALLPHMRKELDLPWFPLQTIETQFTAHGDGDFFAVHTDNSATETSSRRVTFVYYFYIPPQGFEGGELVVYDTTETDGYIGPGEIAHRVEPADNTIVFFPSHAFHEVQPVVCPGNDVEDHRFTINGWFHSAPSEQDIAAVDHLTDAQRFTLPALHRSGFETGETAERLQSRFQQALADGSSNQTLEVGDPRVLPGGPPVATPLLLDPDELLEELKAEHESFAGIDLDPTAVFGFRTFGPGQSERAHTRRAESHVVSTLYCVERSPSSDDTTEEAWPLYLVEHDGTEHSIPLRAGRFVRWESASCPAGFHQPLDSGSVTVLMVHYRPHDWDWSEAKVWQTLREQAASGHDG